MKNGFISAENYRYIFILLSNCCDLKVVYIYYSYPIFGALTTSLSIWSCPVFSPFFSGTILHYLTCHLANCKEQISICSFILFQEYIVLYVCMLEHTQRKLSRNLIWSCVEKKLYTRWSITYCYWNIHSDGTALDLFMQSIYRLKKLYAAERYCRI